MNHSMREHGGGQTQNASTKKRDKDEKQKVVVNKLEKYAHIPSAPQKGNRDSTGHNLRQSLGEDGVTPYEESLIL